MSLHDVRKTAEEVISNHSRQSGAKTSNMNYEYSGENCCICLLGRMTRQ